MGDVDQDSRLLIVGGGPAGLSAARTARQAGIKVVLVDERPSLGGQIYKQPGPGFSVADPSAMDAQFRYGRTLIDAVEQTDVDVQLRTSVLAIEGRSVIVATEGGHARSIRADKIILAPGAHDRPVAFSGWTLPGVLTAGGLQTMVKTQRVVPGERILFAGSGPVALAFPAQLAGYGAGIVAALEAGPAPGPIDASRVALAAFGNTRLLRDAAHYRTVLLRKRIPVHYRRIVVRAEGNGRVERVVHAEVDSNWRVLPGTERTEVVDTLCVGYGFVPSLELMRLVGCDFDFDEDLGGLVVRRDKWLRTSVDDIYAAGDGTGVEGSFVAVDEGRIAGLAAAMDMGAVSAAEAISALRKPRQRLKRRRSLAAATSRLYRVGPGIYELPTPETVICRCEVIRQNTIAAAVESTADINVVKAQTRAGMGLCQGRNCQRQIAAMINNRHGTPLIDIPLASPRAPARPIAISAVADASISGRTLFLAAEETSDSERINGAPAPRTGTANRDIR